MTLGRLVIASLVYHWRMHLAVCAGVIVAAAVLTGSLLVGDSMRGSLRDLTLERLGRVDYALTPPRFFREKLAGETAARAKRERHDVEVAPLILTRGTLSNPANPDFDGNKPSGCSRGVSVIGCDERFWRLCNASDETLPRGRGVAIGRGLADELGVSVGDAVVLRVARPGGIPADFMLGKKSDTIAGSRMTVTAVLDDNARCLPARFALRPSQIRPQNVCVPLAWLQNELEQPGQVNTLLAAGGDDSQALLEAVLQPTADDYGIRVEASPLGYCNITSDGMIVPPAVEGEILDSLGEKYDVRPVLAYLANTISVSGREIPYSTVAALDLNELKDGEVALNRWTAEQLGAKIGDVVAIKYFQPQSDGGRYTELQREFRLVKILEMSGAAADRDLVPAVAGITDEMTMADWDPPFPFDAARIGPADEEYWDKYGSAPKAFVSLSEGRRLWSSRFGRTTSLQVFLPDAAAEPEEPTAAPAVAAVRDSLHFDPAAMVFVWQPVKQMGLAASRGATSFEALFIGFSFFIMAAAVLLTSLLFRLGIDNRAAELGILAALGLPRRLIVRAFLAEGLLVATIGGLVGAAAGAVYAKLMIAGLNTLWLAAIVTPFLRLHVTFLSLAIGAAGGIVAASVAVVLTLRRIGLLSPRELLAGRCVHRKNTLPQFYTYSKRNRSGFLFSVYALTLVIVAVLLSRGVGKEFQAGAFFAAGTIVLVLSLFASWRILKHFTAGGLITAGGGNVVRMAAAGAARHAGRSLTAMGLMAAAFFLIVAVGAFRREPLDKTPQLASGDGRFSLFVRTQLPVYHDLGSAAGREKLGFSADERRLLERCKIFSLRTQPGDDASCLNLYRPDRPTVLGLPNDFIERGGFAWAEVSREFKNNPWLALHGENNSDAQAAIEGPLPVVLERNTAEYALHAGGLGSQLTVENSQGRKVDLKIAGLLAASIFQGYLLVDEQSFETLYPETSGYGVFLLEVPGDGDSDASDDDLVYQKNLESVRTALTRTLSDYGVTVETSGERLAALAVVQNTYIAAFQSLGGLGMLLGTFGLAAVLMRNMVERRPELALLSAVGFRRATLARMVAYENAALLLGGLICGSAAAVVAVLPQLAAGEAVVAWGRLLSTVAGITALGILAGMIAFRMIIAGPLMDSLRRE